MLNRVTRRQVVEHCARVGGVCALEFVQASSAQANSVPNSLPLAVQSLLPVVRRRGMARMRFVGLSIYDAYLWTPVEFDAHHYGVHSFALDLFYWRHLRGHLIAQRAMQEMQRAGSMDPMLAKRWLQFMEQNFPDVQEGDRLTGVHLPQQGAQFFFNGKAWAQTDDAAFSERFFGIWLAPWTSEPRLRSQLLAEL